jgi:hypothetical protein
MRHVARAPQWQTCGVTHTCCKGELCGDYVIDEVFNDRRILVRPDTSAVDPRAVAS